MKRVYKTRGPGPKRTKHKPGPQYYECPEPNAFLVISDQWHQNNVILDSGSNLFLENQNTAHTLKVPYEIREIPLNITAFNGDVSSTRGKYESHPIQREIGTNGHTTIVSCEIADPGTYDMIIPFGWWQHEHPIKNIETPGKWCIEDIKLVEYVQDEGITELFEWHEAVGIDKEARMIGIIGSTRQEEVQLEGLPKLYWQYKELFENEKAEMVALRQTFDDTIDHKDGATPPSGPIYPMSVYQLEELNKYLHKMSAQGKMVHRKSPAGPRILCVPKPDGRLRLCIDYHQLYKLTILDKYHLPLMTELRERVAVATIFTNLHLKEEYHLIRIKRGDEWKTAFRTQYGYYKYELMPFGLVNAPATFQAMMNTILRELLDHGVVVYLDDILIYSKTMEEHQGLVKQVLARLERHDLAV